MATAPASRSHDASAGLATANLKVDTRTALLDAAEALFSERGYAGVGVREIVEQAGANIAAVNYHFGSKRELYVEAVRRSLQRSGTDDVWRLLDDDVDGRPGSHAVPEAVLLARFIRAFFTTILTSEQPSTACNLLVGEASQPSEAVDSVIEHFIRPNQRRLAAAIVAINPALDHERCLLHASSIMGQMLHYRVFRTFMEKSGVARLDQHDDRHRVAMHIASFSLRGLGLSEHEAAAALSAADELDRAAAAEEEDDEGDHA